MSNQDNTDAILDAIRRAGITIPGLEPLSVKAKPTTTMPASLASRRYWLVKNGAYESMVSSQDASNYEDALHVACEPLQPWYFFGTHLDEATVSEVSRDEYIQWIKKGVL